MPAGPAGPGSPFGPGGPAGPSKQPANDNAKPQAMADTKTRVLMLPTPLRVLNLSPLQSEGTGAGVNRV